MPCHRTRPPSLLLALALTLGGPLGCEPVDPRPVPVPPDPDPARAAPAAPDAAAAPAPPSADGGRIETASPETPETPETAETADAASLGPRVAAPPPLTAGAPGRISARHILVAWQGAEGAAPAITRSRAEALAHIRALADQLDQGADFATLAKDESDDASAARGGDLGAFGRGAMVPAFENAAFALKPGQRSDVVESPFGFHLIQRTALVEAHLGHVLVQWEGVPRSSATRTKEEARAIAETARQRLVAGESLSVVAPELSEGPSAARGGDLGVFQKGQMMDSFDEVAFRLKVGEVSPVTETAAGFHVIQRLP